MYPSSVTLEFPELTEPISEAIHILVARFSLTRKQLGRLAARLEALQQELLADHLVASTHLRGTRLVVCYAAPRRIRQVTMRSIFTLACKEVGLFRDRKPQRRPHSRRKSKSRRT